MSQETMEAMTFVRGVGAWQTLYLVQSGRKNLYLAKSAAEDFLKMKLAAAHDKITIFLNSAFREAAHQERLYKTYLEEYAAWRAGDRKTKPTPVARPGFSNHQSGTAIDIQRADGDNLKTAAPDSPVDLWLIKNAAAFNFKRTVPSEAWHYDWFAPKKDVS